MATSRLLIVIAATTALTGCFTGVESTPRIKAPDAREAQLRARPEDSYLADIKDEPFDRWLPGKLFDIVDNRFALLLGSTAPAVPLAGRQARWVGASETATALGTTSTRLKFLADGVADTLVYSVGRSLPALRENGALEIPFAVQRSLVDSAAARMTGKSYYLTSAVWRDSTDAVVTGRKFVAAKVTAVRPGNADYPLRVDFEVADGAEPATGILFLSPQARFAVPRTFDAFFSLTDPRASYPGIPDDIWRHIILGTVTEGMTRLQARLAMGQPRDIQRRVGNGAYLAREVWVYPSGQMLFFEDGFLVNE